MDICREEGKGRHEEQILTQSNAHKPSCLGSAARVNSGGGCVDLHHRWSSVDLHRFGRERERKTGGRGGRSAGGKIYERDGWVAFLLGLPRESDTTVLTHGVRVVRLITVPAPWLECNMPAARCRAPEIRQTASSLDEDLCSNIPDWLSEFMYVRRSIHKYLVRFVCGHALLLESGYAASFNWLTRLNPQLHAVA